ncbi:MAG TPA: phenylacetate--CoA ligase family protein [Candidatus Limnocylindria bacterium]|nr:phenylacetate--CoA ligase family protein [Candidatus Limnocylindria bacterium]
MSILERVYAHSPIGFQHLMTSVAGWRKNATRYGRAYWEHREFLKEFDTWGLERQEEYQAGELRRLLRYAAERSPFYRRLYAGVDVGAVRTPADLPLLPTVDKEAIRANIRDVMTQDAAGTVEEHTGGTTGMSLVVRQRIVDSMRRMATLDHFKARVGFEHLRMKRATFNGKHIVPPGQKEKVFWRYNAACRQMIYSSFYITEENIPHYIDSLNRFRPDALDGFFTCLTDVAGYMERKGIRPGFKPVAIFPTSETLSQPGRELLERVFGCRVYDQYASSEGAPFVTECARQRLHMDLSSGVFEHEEGSDEVLVTSFTTYATPLIRYRIGDSMAFAPRGEKCACGLAAPLVESIQGRRLDFLYTPQGARVNAGNVANLLKNMPNTVIRAQFVQDRLDHITALLEVDRDLYRDEHDALLRGEFLQKFGPDMRVDIRRVDSIPREGSGKFRMIKNDVQL